MALKILIATPERTFGEKISKALQESGYSPMVVPSTAEAAFIVQYEKCPIAILDCDLPDPGPAYLAADLRAHFEDLRIIFVHPGNSNAEKIEINPARDIYLPSPFFMPDLMEVIHLWVAEKKAALDEEQTLNIPLTIPPELEWLQDVNRAAQYLTRLSLEVDAQAALIIQNTRIWAYAGQLSQAAVEELTQFVGHHWTNGDGSDLARFVRLETTSSEYMLYVTSLGSGFVLALSFQAEMPFSKIRAQTGELARKLTSPLLKSHLEISKSPVPEELPNTITRSLSEGYQWVPEAEGESVSVDNEDRNSGEAKSDQQQVMFQDFLAILDIPEPDGSSDPEPMYTETKFSRPVEVQHREPAILPETREDAPLVLETVPSKQAEPLTQYDVQLEPTSLALHDLAYACVLIPRLPDHHLTGIMTGLLNVELSRLCLAFGWRLEHLAIRPQYLHWVVTVTPDVPASQVIQKIREQTSILIFNEFPRLAIENPSSDFWAPGYMTIHGRRSLAGSLIQDYIHQTRTRQGIDKL
ncbi:transposase [Chloroflexota bacterium]